MKNLFIFAAALTLMACGGGNSQKTSSESAETAVAPENAIGLDDLLQTAENHVGQQVTVVGYVTHTCKHSGKRCFIVGEGQKTSMRVEAKGEIGGFNRELTGSRVAITGTLRENRLSREYLDQMEKDLNNKSVAEPSSGDVCAAELANIGEMKAWMQTSGKDYYPVYYLDGESYEVVEE